MRGTFFAFLRGILVALAMQALSFPLAGMERVTALGEVLDCVEELDDGLMCAVTHNRVKLFHPQKVNEPVASYWTNCRSDRTLASHKGFVYLLNRGPVEILDARNNTLRSVGRLEIHAHDLVLASSAGQSYLAILDRNSLDLYALNDPATPQLMGRVDLGFPAQKLAFQEDILYANGDEKFAVVDLKEPSQPLLLGTVSVSKLYAGGLAVKYPLVYAANGHKLRIFDVSDSTQPKLDHDCAVGGLNSHALVEGDWFWSWGMNSPLCFNLTNEINPIIAEINDGFVGGSKHAYFQTADGRLVRWAERGELKAGEPLNAESIVIYGKYAFVSGNRGRVFDLSNPAEPREVGPLKASGKMVVGDGRLYTSSSILDISNPEEVKTVGHREGHAPWAVYGNYIYETLDNSLVLYNATYPQSLVKIGSFELEYKPVALHCKGDILYVSTGWDGGLCVYRIKADYSLEKLAQLQVCINRNYITSFASEGNSLYVGLCGEGVAMLDVSHPEAPKVVSRVATHQQAVDVSIWEPGWLAVADGCSGPLIVDFTNPKRARVMDVFPTADVNNGVATYKGHLYSCERKGGLRVFALDRQAMKNAPPAPPSNGSMPPQQ